MTKSSQHRGATIGRVLAVLAVVIGSANCGWAQTGPHHGFLSGPWEVVIQRGFEKAPVRVPVVVDDDNKPQSLNRVVAVPDTPLKVRLDSYVPHLTWETYSTEHPGAGALARLQITGPSLDRQLWLDTGDPTKQSISSRIGGIALREFRNAKSSERLLTELRHPEAVGTLSFWPQDAQNPLEYVVRPGQKIRPGQPNTQLTVLRYVAHYSIDVKTRTVTSQSDRPINPAIQVRIENEGDVSERWLWTNYRQSPHAEKGPPLRMQFADFHLRGADGRYIILVTPDADPQLLRYKEGKLHVEPAKLSQPYPFGDTEYSFAIEQVVRGAILRTKWKNASEMLVRPAIVATIEEGDKTDEVILELGQPAHHKAESGTLVLVYRRITDPPGKPEA